MLRRGGKFLSDFRDREQGMPIRDPFKLQLALDHNFKVKICRRCGARNPWDAERCRRCKSRDLRPKRYRK